MMIWRSLQPNALGRLLEIAVDAYRNRKAVRTAGHFDDDEPGRPTTGSDRRPAKDKDAARTVTGASYHPMEARDYIGAGGRVTSQDGLNTFTPD